MRYALFAMAFLLAVLAVFSFFAVITFFVSWFQSGSMPDSAWFAVVLTLLAAAFTMAAGTLFDMGREA